MRFWKRLYALLLAVVMLFSLSGCGLFGLFNNIISNSHSSSDDLVSSSGTKFSDMKYSRPDSDEMRECVDGICNMLDDAGAYDDVISALDEFYTLYWNFYTMYTLAEIRSDLDTTDAYYSGEYDYCMGVDATVSTMFTELMLACANSDMADELDSDYFGGLLAENYSFGYEYGVEKLNSLYAQESALLTEYRSQLVDFYEYENTYDGYEECNADMCQTYIDLVKVRHQIARECGYDSYEEMAYDGFGREYGPDDMQEYLDAVKEYLVPLFRDANEKGILDDAYYRLRELSPEDSLKTVENTVSKMDRVFEKSMNFMKGCELYDVSLAPEKLETSYVIYIDDYESPFLFVKTSGYEEDILTIAHEFGHFTDSRENFDMNGNLDTSETLSQGLEYLILCYLDDSRLARRLAEYKMTDALYVYINQACFNEFEHRVFSLPENQLNVDTVNSIYRECAIEYGFGSENDDSLGLSWVDINHFFEYPFYVISYCVSDSAAFSMYCMELENPGSGLEVYLNVLEDAENMDFIELLESAGLDSPISADTIKDIADVIEEKLGL